jgi:NADH:ubiquinone oxidoreductase subunit F (NADH-binding)
LAAHLDRRGPLPAVSAEQLLDLVGASGLTGRGGAAFPVSRKLQAVAFRAGPAVVIGNGAEGEPAAFKDKELLRRDPRLVLDGLALAARAVGAEAAYLYVHDDRLLLDVVRRAVAERITQTYYGASVRVVVARDRFISGEESAVVAAIEGRSAVPRAKPPRVSEHGAFGRPTLVQNVETLTHLAVIARYGAGAFRSAGTPDERAAGGRGAAVEHGVRRDRVPSLCARGGRAAGRPGRADRSPPCGRSHHSRERRCRSPPTPRRLRRQ